MSPTEPFIEEPASEVRWVPSRRENFWAGLPPLVTALTYTLVLTLGPLGFLGEDFRVLLQVEFLVIHSFPFLGGFIFLRKVLETKNKKEGKDSNPVFLNFFFWGLLVLYVGVSFTLGWRGPIYFFAATLATYLGFWLKRFDPLAMYHLAGRWVACFFFYFVFISVFDLSNSVSLWRVEAKTFRMGLFYFLVLGLLECFGFYDWVEWKIRKIIKDTTSVGK
jgi:hypothetical protein